MERTELTAPKRRFAGRRDTPPSQDPLDALAEAFLSHCPAPSPSAAPAAVSEEFAAAACASAETVTAAVAPPPEGLYVLIPSGIEPPNRRRAALDVARRLAPPNRPAAVFVFDGPMVDAHVLGEVAGGRLGPQNYLTAADIDRTIANLMGQCAQIAIAILGEPNGEVRRLGPAAPRTIFLVRPDGESIVETYRGLKIWRQGGARSEAALVVLGGDGGEDAGRLHRRLRKTARAFLGCDLSVQGGLAAAGPITTSEHPEPLCLFSHAPADRVWPCLLAAARCDPANHRQTAGLPAAAQRLFHDPDCRAAAFPGGRESGGIEVRGDLGRPPRGGLETDSNGEAGASGAPHAPSQENAPAIPDICPVFSLWKPDDRAELLAAIEAQAPGLLAGGLRMVFAVGVDEPGAPPLAAVRDDGALVAILVPEPGETVDTPAAEKWLAVHRDLLARAYPSAGIAAGATTSAMVLAPLEPPPADGIRRFLPVRMGGHRGVVLLP